MTLSAPDKETVGTVLGRIPSGVSILTAYSKQGPVGMMASWVQQVGFEPPFVSVAVHPERSVYKVIDETKHFTLNLVPKDDPTLMRAFGRSSDNPFETLELEEKDGLVFVKQALGGLGCFVKETVKVADHHLFVAEVIDARLYDADLAPYLHVRKSGFNY